VCTRNLNQGSQSSISQTDFGNRRYSRFQNHTDVVGYEIIFDHPANSVAHTFPARKGKVNVKNKNKRIRLRDAPIKFPRGQLFLSPNFGRCRSSGNSVGGEADPLARSRRAALIVVRRVVVNLWCPRASRVSSQKNSKVEKQIAAPARNNRVLQLRIADCGRAPRRARTTEGETNTTQI
jgi:hypothetical protein